MKDKAHMIISIHAEKASIQHFFMKTLNKLRIGGRYFNTMKATHDRPRTFSISSKIWIKRQGCPLLPLLCNIV
jgi:hypothetical protein